MEGWEEGRGEGSADLGEGGCAGVFVGVSVIVNLLCKGKSDSVEAEEVGGGDTVAIEALEVVGVYHMGAFCCCEGFPISDAQLSQRE
jgi:hypothetical protein